MKTIAEYLVEALVAAGVRRVYGVVGDSLNSSIGRKRRVHIHGVC